MSWTASLPTFEVLFETGIEVVSAGLFVSSGRGEHPDRVLDNNELVVVKKGILSLFEEEVRFDVPAGHALLLHRGRRHRAAAPFAPDLAFYWIHFVVREGSLGSSRIQLPQFSPVERPECVAELFHRYLDDQESRRLDAVSKQLLLLSILKETSRSSMEGQPRRGAVLVGRAEEYVTHHLSERLSTTRIARALRVNPDYLNRVFRSVHHTTVTEYIHRRRLADAAGMLRDSTDAIGEIASACGYPSLGHFRKMFERHHGVSPSAYRRMMARAHINAR